MYSRKIVGAEVHDSDDAEHAVHLVRRTALAERIATMDTKPVLHGDNGSTLKATTVLAMLHWLGVKPSYSRPRVSDDNAFAESLFRTAKYRPEFPPRASPVWTMPGPGQPSSCVGTTSVTATAASATSARSSATPVCLIGAVYLRVLLLHEPIAPRQASLHRRHPARAALNSASY